MKNYFISYSHSCGFGSCVANCEKSLRTKDGVDMIKIAVQKSSPKLEGIIIINFIELDDTEAD